MKMRLCLLLCFALTACAPSVDVPNLLLTPRPSPNAKVILAAMSDLTIHHQKWQSQSIAHYRFVLNVVCFCLYPDMTVEVGNGKLVSVSDPTGKDISSKDDAGRIFFIPNVGGSDALISFLKSLTIDELFTYAETAISKADSFSVEYHAQYDYPTQISVGWNQQEIDSGESATITNFEILP